MSSAPKKQEAEKKTEKKEKGTALRPVPKPRAGSRNPGKEAQPLSEQGTKLNAKKSTTKKTTVSVKASKGDVKQKAAGSPVARTPPYGEKQLIGTQTKEAATRSTKTPKQQEAAADTKTPTPASVKRAEKWPAEETAKAWIKSAEDFNKVKNEYLEIQEMGVDVEGKCKKWKAHPKLNQSEEDPVLDANLVKCSDANDYVNMVQMTVPFSRKVLLGQLPLPGTEETFWKTVFELRVMSLHILNEEAVSFFPLRNGEFVHYGSMFVNNRRAETNGDVLRCSIEVLPAGFSNSIIITVTVINNWAQHHTHGKQSVVMKEVREVLEFMNTSLPDESALIISKIGNGRAALFLALMIAVHKMDQKIEPNVFEIVQSIRSQRPNALEYLTQYAAIYIALFYYIKRKMAGNAESSLYKKATQLTTTFTDLLTKDMEAGKSVVMPPE